MKKTSQIDYRELNSLFKRKYNDSKEIVMDEEFTNRTKCFILETKTLPENAIKIDFVANHPQFDWIRKFRESKNNIPLKSIINKQRFSYGLSKSALDSGEIGFLNVQHFS